MDFKLIVIAFCFDGFPKESGIDVQLKMLYILDRLHAVVISLRATVMKMYLIFSPLTINILISLMNLTNLKYILLRASRKQYTDLFFKPVCEGKT